MPNPNLTLIEVEYRDTIEKIKKQLRIWAIEMDNAYPTEVTCLNRIKNEMRAVERDL